MKYYIYFNGQRVEFADLATAKFFSKSFDCTIWKIIEATK